MEEAEIIVEQPLAGQGRTRFTRESGRASSLSGDEQEDDTANERGWETVDEDDLSARPLPARSGRESSSSSRRSLTLSVSTATSSLPTLSPTREGATADRRNLSSDSGRYGDVIHEGDEGAPLTPIDGEEELLKPQLSGPTGRVVLPTNSTGDSKRVSMAPLDLDVVSASATINDLD